MVEEESSLKKLVNGLTSLVFKKTTTEPEYEVLNRMSIQCAVIQKRSQYSMDLERAISEVELTTKLLTSVETSIIIEEKVFEPEDVVIYYNGVFLEFIHTIKDKIFRLVWWMAQNDDSKLDEPDTVKINNLREISKEIGINNLLNEWDQESLDSKIAVCLRRRTHHHHFISNLRYNQDFQHIRLAKTMLATNPHEHLSEYGKNEMVKLGKEAYEKWRNEVTIKQNDTLKSVKENINALAVKLIEFYKVPIGIKEQVDIMNKYLEVQNNFRIENKTSLENIRKSIIEKIGSLISRIKQEYKLISAYLIGSLPRGEFINGSSDINMILIADSNVNITSDYNISRLFNIISFSEKKFLSDEAKKFRFFCKYDGLLIYGKEFKFDEREFPKPGLLLAILLNKGFIDELEFIKKYILEINNPNNEILRFYSLKMIKIMLDFIFGEAISNKPYYTSSRQQRIEFTKEMFPQSFRTTLIYEDIYFNRTINQTDFQLIIDSFIEKAKINWEKMLEVEKEILN
jgi:hypothetical protein